MIGVGQKLIGVLHRGYLGLQRGMHSGLILDFDKSTPKLFHDVMQVISTAIELSLLSLGHVNYDTPLLPPKNSWR